MWPPVLTCPIRSFRSDHLWGYFPWDALFVRSTNMSLDPVAKSQAPFSGFHMPLEASVKALAAGVAVVCLRPAGLHLLPTEKGSVGRV